MKRLRDSLMIYIQGPRLLQLCVYGVLLAVLMLYIVAYPPGTRDWRFYGTVLALTSLLVLNIGWSNPNPADSPRMQAIETWAFLILSAGLVLATIFMSRQADLTNLLAIVVAQAAFKRGVWLAGVLFAAANVAACFVLGQFMALPLAALIPVLSSLVVGCIFVLLVTTLVVRYTRQTERAEALLRQLQTAQVELAAAQQKEKELAVVEERMRLARDIHDGLGHHLIVLIVQLQAAAKLVERNAQAAAQSIEICRAEAQMALDEVRVSVSTLRQPPEQALTVPGQPPVEQLSESLASLIQSFGRNTNLQTSFDVSGAPHELSPSVRETLFRAAQEGLTNTQKHGVKVRCVAVHLEYTHAFIRLAVTDDGRIISGGEAAHPSGFGLVGLRERVVQLGGELHFGYQQGGIQNGENELSGFRLEIRLPIGGRQDDPGRSSG